MVDRDALQHTLLEYVRTTVGAYSIGQMLYRITDQAVEVLGCHGAGVSLGDEGRLRFVTATDEPVARIEEDQLQTQQGPCHDAFSQDTQVLVDDVATWLREWPDYGQTALREGCQAVMGIPMRVDGTTIGAVNIYNRQPHRWVDEEVEAAQLLADMASGYVTNLRHLSSAQHLASQLRQALDSRVVIEQAKGIVAVQHDIDPSAAFERLRTYARTHRQRVHDVAHEIVERRLEV